MNNYLVIVTTILVISQVIRITQNAISLHRQRKKFEHNIGHLKDLEIEKEDFAYQKKAYRLIVEKLERENASKMEVGGMNARTGGSTKED